MSVWNTAYEDFRRPYYEEEKKAKKDYDGDGKVESGSKEHAGAVHNAIQKKKGGTPDGQDTRKEEIEVEEGYKEIDKKKENKMYRRAGNLARTALSSKGKKKETAMNKSNKIVSAIARQKENERFSKMGDEKARSNYKEESEIEEGMKQARKNVGASTCWDGYKAQGTKKKNGKEVPNCVKEDEVAEGYGKKKKKMKKEHANWRAEMGFIDEASCGSDKPKEKKGVKNKVTVMPEVKTEETELQEGPYIITKPDITGNTPAYRNFKAGMKSKVTGKPMYQLAPGVKLPEETIVIEKKVCTKCEGKGCDHCDSKGYHAEEITDLEEKRGLYANIHAKRARGEAPAKPGDEDYPAKDAFKKAAKTAKKEEVELDENRRAARSAGGYKDDSKKQPDPSKDGFTGIGNMSIDQIRKMSARIDKEKKSKKEEFELDEADSLAAMQARREKRLKAQRKKMGTSATGQDFGHDYGISSAERKKRQQAEFDAFVGRGKKEKKEEVEFAGNYEGPLYAPHPDLAQENLQSTVDSLTKKAQGALKNIGVKINNTPRPTARPSTQTQNTMRQNKMSNESLLDKVVKTYVSEEDYDRMKDRRQERGGVAGNVDYKRAPKNNTNKFGKGKTAMQKELEKKHGKGKSAMDIVRAEIQKKHGKGALMDKKKKDN